MCLSGNETCRKCALAQTVYEFGHGDIQAAREFDNVEQAHVTLSALDPANVVAVQVSQLRQLFLRQMALLPKLADTLSEHDTWIGAWHAAIICI